MSKIPIQLSEGEVFYKWSYGRVKKNKNVISVTTGQTGSGKSYNDLRKAEIHYKNLFKENFPIENCCFSVAHLIERINSKELRKGEILILEEAGVNAGSADWQNKVVKMFNYVLQSFRSMNIILFLNLPVFTMLSKQARQLTHIHMETKGIDFKTNKLVVKPLVQQLNQHTGKSYWKYLRVKAGKKVVSVERMLFSLPSQELIDKYESKKQSFLLGITQEFAQEIRKQQQAKLDKVDKIMNELNEEENEMDKEYIERTKKGEHYTKIAESWGVTPSAVFKRGQRIAKRRKKLEIALKKVDISILNSKNDA